MVAKHLVPLCLLTLILAGAPPLGAQPLNIGDRPMEQKEEAEPVKPPGKKPMTESKVVIVDEILPDDHVKLPPDGTTVEKRRILGTNLNRGMDVKVLRGSASTSAVTATLRPTNKTDRRQLWLTAKEGAPAGTDYRVRLVAGGQTIDLPLTVEVLPKKIDAAAVPSALSTASTEEKKPAIDPASRGRLLQGMKTGQIAHPPGTLKEAPGSGGGIKVDPPSAFGVKARGLKPPGGKEITGSPGPGGSKIDPGLLEDAGIVEIPDARLHVKRSDAIEAWGTYWKDRPAMTNSFRWLTLRGDIVSWRWEVSDHPDFGNIVASGTSDTPPEKGHYSFFDIDFAKIAAADPAERYYVRVVPALPAGKKGKKREDIEPSNRVNVIISEPIAVTQFTEPVITGVMPFSSCDPGGTVVLKGFQFGEEPGEILLGLNLQGMSLQTMKAILMHYESREIPLETMEWSPTLATAKVPVVRGVPDLQVTVGVRTADGRESSRDLTCFFRATREEIALNELCDGIMIDHGGYYADADDFHFSLGKRDDPRLAVWHRSSDAQADEDLVMMTRPLRNGWKYTRYEFGQTSSRNVDGWIREVVGFRPGSGPHNIAVRWEVDEAEIGWQMYIYAEGPAGAPLWDDKWYEPQWCHPRGY